MLAENLSEMLGSMGHNAECVGSSQEAISRFSVDRFDLVVIDGHEQAGVARAIKDVAPSTRVILATGSSELFDGSLLANGVDFVLHKPFSDDDLERALSLRAAQPSK